MYYSTSILFGNPQKKMSFFIEEAPDLLAQYPVRREVIRPNAPSVLIGSKQRKVENLSYTNRQNMPFVSCWWFSRRVLSCKIELKNKRTFLYFFCLWIVKCSYIDEMMNFSHKSCYAMLSFKEFLIKVVT